MAKFNMNDYEFVDISERAESSVVNLSANELEEMVQATMEVLNATKGKLKQTPKNLCLAAGVLGVRGGEFKKVVPLYAKYDKGNASKAELKVLKKVFNTARLYYLVSNLTSMAADKSLAGDDIYAYLARKKK